MLILLSPAKTLDFTPQASHAATKPTFLTQANKLAKQLKALSPAKLAKLMGISPKLAETAHGYYAAWKTKYDPPGAKEAIFAFRGDVYQGLEADCFSSDDLADAQRRLRLLSGLYGILRPLDLIQPYRLEMSAPLAGDHGKDLYVYWGDSIAKSLLRELADHADETIVNLASQEYFAAAATGLAGRRVLTPSFRDLHNGQYKVISFFAKKARGMMARFLIERRIDSPAGLAQFRAGGYRYNRQLSNEDKPAFTRDRPPKG